jgi:hypothetical protein
MSNSKASKLKRGFALATVLGFMTLATLVVVGTYAALSSWDKTRAQELYYATGEEAGRAGLRHAEAWISNKPMDAASIMQTYYEKGMNQPIRIPLDSTTNTSQNYKVYLIGMEVSTNPAIPTRVKLQSMGKGRDESEVTMTGVFKVAGIYLYQTSFSVSTTGCGPDVALWLGSGADTVRTPLTIDSGGAYFGQNMQIANGKELNITGDLIFGDTSSTKNTVQGRINVSGDFLSVNPLEVYADASHSIGGSAYFMKGVLPPNKSGNDQLQGQCCLSNPGTGADCPQKDLCGTFRGSWSIAKDLTLGRGTNTSLFFNIQNGKSLTVGRNFDARSTWRAKPMFIKWHDLSWVSATPNGIISVANSMRVDSIDLAMDISGSAALSTDSLLVLSRIQNSANSTISTDFKYMLNGGATCFLNNSGKIKIGSTNNTTCPASSSFNWTGTDTLIGLQAKLGSRKQIPLSFGVDTSLIDTYKISWKAMCDSAKRYFTVTGTCGDKFKISQANEIAANISSLPSKFKLENFIIINLDLVGDSYKFEKSGGNLLNGNWVFVQTTGTADLNNSSSWGAFPSNASTSRVLVWFRNTASITNWRLESPGQFYGIFFHQGQNFTSSSGAGAESYRGAFYLNNTGTTLLADRSSAMSVRLDPIVIADIEKMGLTKVDENGNKVSSCAASALGTALTSGEAYFKVTAAKLEVSMESIFTNQISIDRVPAWMDSINSTNFKSKPYLDFSRPSLSIPDSFSAKSKKLSSLLSDTNYAFNVLVAYNGKLEKFPSSLFSTGTSIKSAGQRTFGSLAGQITNNCTVTTLGDTTNTPNPDNNMNNFSKKLFRLVFKVDCGNGLVVKRAFMINVGGAIANNPVSSSSSLSSSSSSTSSSSSLVASSSSSLVVVSSSAVVSSSSVASSPCTNLEQWTNGGNYFLNSEVRTQVSGVNKSFKCTGGAWASFCKTVAPPNSTNYGGGPLWTQTSTCP